MRFFKTTTGKLGLALLLANEVRGLLVVLSILGGWTHAGKANPFARPAPPAACASATAPAVSAPCGPR